MFQNIYTVLTLSHAQG